MRKRHTIQADKLWHKRNRPPQDEPWCWFPRSLLESDAWRSAPINTRRVVDRLLLEHMAHAGTMNGQLICTYKDFEKAGIRHESLITAIQDAGARGLISITQKGRASTGEDRWPSKYALGWLPTHDGVAAPNRWKSWLQKPAKDTVSPRSGSGPGKSRKHVNPQVRNRTPAPGPEADLGTTDFQGSPQVRNRTYSQYIGCKGDGEPRADPWAELEIPACLRRRRTAP
jgi:hypothetical protein